MEEGGWMGSRVALTPPAPPPPPPPDQTTVGHKADESKVRADLHEPYVEHTECNAVDIPPGQVQAGTEPVQPVPMPPGTSTASVGTAETSQQVTNEGDLGRGKQPRIGIDIGGVLTRDGDPTRDRSEEWGPDWEAPDAFTVV